jgi:hypothetical protein
MTPIDVARRPSGALTVDLCATCQALWFDTYESLQLTPGGTIDLLRAIHAAQRDTPRPLASALSCPRCDTVLAATQDVQRTTRFSYFRCRYGHGRLTPFVQFMLEKNFVRPLAPSELARLALTATTIRCSSCGAPVELARGMCTYCRSPLVILDPDALQHALADYDAAERRRVAPAPDPDRQGDAIIAMAGLEQALARSRAADPPGLGADLVTLGLVALGHWLRV